MNVVLILLSASLSIAIGFLLAFIWSVKNGQFEDDYTPSVRMLFDDNKPGAMPLDAASDKMEVESTYTETKKPKP